MATYSGRVIEIITEKASYAAGEVVRAKIHYTATRVNGLAWLAWHTRAKVFVNGVLKDEDETTHGFPGGVDVIEHTTRWFNLGSMPSRNMTGKVEIWCGG